MRLLTPERMLWTAKAGEAGRRCCGARRQRPEGEGNGGELEVEGVPARFNRRGGRGEQGETRGGVGMARGGRRRRRARRRRTLAYLELGLGFPRGEKEQGRARWKGSTASWGFYPRGGGHGIDAGARDTAAWRLPLLLWRQGEEQDMAIYRKPPASIILSVFLLN